MESDTPVDSETTGRERETGAHSESPLSANPHGVGKWFRILQISRIVPAFFGYGFL